ncbi:type II toxin-antitoxin system HicB family antitoxin [Enterovirga sp. CN4-39]|uniref:type II toxin-antitoxin system HicB family antitoxin n=1 Tax=Enterovirga sp. CN4-39 TaxID=3400910 RepID=UPI003BFD64CE
MPHYIALIHKDPTSCFGASFPDVPGVVAAGDTLDEVIEQASEALAFAAEDWEELTGHSFPRPRTLDALRTDSEFISESQDAVVAAIPFLAPVRDAA